MLLRIFHIIWFVLLVNVLPATAQDYLLSGAQHAGTSLQLPHNAPWDIGSPAPQSDTPITPNELAVLPQTRACGLLRQVRSSDSDEEPTTPPFLTATFTQHTVADSLQFTEAPYRSYAHHFRLAGWKETNALYVALNSQFS
ncbi:hypothetical protein [Thaumasiovibrio subtropicus]|uniref:hypothetical protein n=1 Tax=Thaumasiovibrio subtropicus TaxID=1891207 RepID=UPI000B35BB3F|nr:hypothetical protein [Thaumasiovibrio subtropicus]